MMSLTESQEMEEQIRYLLLRPYSNGSVSIATEDIQIHRICESSSHRLQIRIIYLNIFTKEKKFGFDMLWSGHHQNPLLLCQTCTSASQRPCGQGKVALSGPTLQEVKMLLVHVRKTRGAMPPDTGESIRPYFNTNKTCSHVKIFFFLNLHTIKDNKYQIVFCVNIIFTNQVLSLLSSTIHLNSRIYRLVNIYSFLSVSYQYNSSGSHSVCQHEINASINLCPSEPRLHPLINIYLAAALLIQRAAA